MYGILSSREAGARFARGWFILPIQNVACVSVVLVTVGLIFGLILGSFIVTLVVRWPALNSALVGRSRCDHCGEKLTARELLPLFSYFLQRRRARCCGRSINPLHPVAEALAAAVGLIAFGLFGRYGYASALFGWVLLALALFDVRHFVLPDWLNGSLLLAGLAVPLFEPSSSDRLIGALTGYILLEMVAFLYSKIKHREGLGGGDAKLLGAVGAWVGWQPLPIIILMAGVFGLATAGMLKMAGAEIRPTTRLPLGAFIAAAAWLTWIQLQLIG